MKIAILGYSGSGKSTLGRALGEFYGVPVLHLDTVMFLPNWQERQKDEQRAIVQRFMDENENWVIDGNYGNLLRARRLEEADVIVLMLFNRFSSLVRVTRRYLRYRGHRRPDMAEGCSEKLDAEFIRWVLWKGRTKGRCKHLRDILKQYPGKCVVIKNQRQINRYLQETHDTGKEQTHAGSL